MKSQFLHEAYSSFLLWLDHELISSTDAYVNVSGRLFNINDNDFKQYKIFSGPFAQWVADSSITGANIPSGVFVNNNFANRGDSGLILDFQKGRVLFNDTFNQNNIVTTKYSFKEFNLYKTEKTDASLFYESKFTLKPRTIVELTGLSPDNVVFPCMFVKNTNGVNVPYSFGGEDLTKYEFRVSIISDSSYKLDAACSAFQDSKQKIVCLVKTENLPYNIYGDLKSGYYNYNEIPKNGHMNIDEVTISKWDENLNKKVHNKCQGAFVDFELTIPRYPRKR